MYMIHVSIYHKNTFVRNTFDMPLEKSVSFVKNFTVKPVYNDHLSNKIYHLWFIQ